MVHYYNVILSHGPTLNILVKARDVIDAGQKVVDYFAKYGYGMNDFGIVKIERTDIDKVLD